MSAVAPLRGPKGAAVTHDRAPIRDAIAGQRVAEAALLKHLEAVERARSLVAGAERALDQARQGVERARVNESALIAESARSGTPKSRSDSLKLARAAELDCADQVEAARAALASLETGELTALEQDILRAKANVIAAVNAFIADPAASALARAKKAKADYLASREMFWAIASGSTDKVPDLQDWGDQHRARDACTLPLRDLIAAGNSFFGSGLGVDPETFTQNSRIAQAWRQFRSDLRSNADAEMPPPE